MSFSQTYLEKPDDLPIVWQEAWNSRDALALANLFVEDAAFINVVGLWWHNRQDIWKAHDYGLRVIFNQSFLEVRRISVKKVSSEIAVVYARMKLSGQSSHGSIEHPADRMNICSFVMKKESKGWVCVSAHNTDIVPGQETNLVNEKGEMSSVDYRVH